MNNECIALLWWYWTEQILVLPSPLGSAYSLPAQAPRTAVPHALSADDGIGLNASFRDLLKKIQQAVVLFFMLMLSSQEWLEDQDESHGRVFQRSRGLESKKHVTCPPSTLNVCYCSSLRPFGLCLSVYLCILHSSSLLTECSGRSLGDWNTSLLRKAWETWVCLA